ncbi:MAG: Cof-type HAD-IIB family hydrolase [Chloroflexota bacterium]
MKVAEVVAHSFRLVAFDLDQTLFGDDLTPSLRVRKAIAQAQAQGVLVTLATGREAGFTSQYARLFDLQAPIICLQGGLIYDFRRERVLHETRLPESFLPEIVSAAERYGWNLHWEMADRLYLPQESNHPAAFFELLRASRWSRLTHLLDVPEAPHKFLVVLNAPGERAQVLAQVQKTFGQQLHIVPSHPLLIEGVPREVDKGQGLAWLANYLHISPAQVMAVGDNDNDIPMIEWAGKGVAMGHASPGAKSAADWIAPDLTCDGAAIVIEKFILTEENAR